MFILRDKVEFITPITVNNEKATFEVFGRLSSAGSVWIRIYGFNEEEEYINLFSRYVPTSGIETGYYMFSQNIDLSVYNSPDYSKYKLEVTESVDNEVFEWFFNAGVYNLQTSYTKDNLDDTITIGWVLDTDAFKNQPLAYDIHVRRRPVLEDPDFEDPGFNFLERIYVKDIEPIFNYSQNGVSHYKYERKYIVHNTDLMYESAVYPVFTEMDIADKCIIDRYPTQFPKIINISTYEDLQALKDFPAQNIDSNYDLLYRYISYKGESVYFTRTAYRALLRNDLDLTGIEYTPVMLGMDFNGMGYKIKNPTITRTSGVSSIFLSKSTAVTPSIRDLTIEDVSFKGGEVYGLFDKNFSIESCKVTGVLRGYVSTYGLGSLTRTTKGDIFASNSSFTGYLFSATSVSLFKDVANSTSQIIDTYVDNCFIRGKLVMTEYVWTYPLEGKPEYSDSTSALPPGYTVAGFAIKLANGAQVSRCFVDADIVSNMGINSIAAFALNGDTSSLYNTRHDVEILECFTKGNILTPYARSVSGFLGDVRNTSLNSTIKYIVRDSFTATNITGLTTRTPFVLTTNHQQLLFERFHSVGKITPTVTLSDIVTKPYNSYRRLENKVSRVYLDSEKTNITFDYVSYAIKGYLTSEMELQENFPTFDFVNIWEMDLERRHPVLRKIPFDEDTGGGEDPELTPVDVWYDLKASSSKGVVHFVLTEEDISDSKMPIMTSSGIKYIFTLPQSKLSSIAGVSDGVFYGIKISSSEGVRVLPTFLSSTDNFIQIEEGATKYGYLFKPKL